MSDESRRNVTVLKSVRHRCTGRASNADHICVLTGFWGVFTKPGYPIWNFVRQGIRDQVITSGGILAPKSRTGTGIGIQCIPDRSPDEPNCGHLEDPTTVFERQNVPDQLNGVCEGTLILVHSGVLTRLADKAVFGPASGLPKRLQSCALGRGHPGLNVVCIHDLGGYDRNMRQVV
jgi:hypothetical protein